MAAVVTEIDPPRGRSGDVIRILGSGFGATVAENAATVGGISASILAASSTEVQVVVPAGLTPSFQVLVLVTNTADGTSASRAWFVVPDAGDLLVDKLPAQQPGAQEDLLAEIALRAEAKDFERLVGFAEAFPQEILPSSVGASQVGVDPDAYRFIEPATPDVQATLEAIDAAFAQETIVIADTGTVGNVGAGEDVLESVTIPGGTLERDGDRLVVTAWGTYGLVSAVSKRAILRMAFGGTDLGIEGVAAGPLPGFDTGDVVGWRIVADILRVSPVTQAANASKRVSGSTPIINTTLPSETLAGDVTLEITGENATDAVDDVVVWEGLVVELRRRRTLEDRRSPSDAALVGDSVATEVS